MTVPTSNIAMGMTSILCITIITVINANDFERLPPINSPLRDTNGYRGIKLANGLQVLLISDRVGYLNSGAALTVHIGAMNDVKEQPGIINLLRYLLLVANGKYSKRHEFERFLHKRDGKLDTHFTYYNNDAEHKQHFSFDIDSDFLPHALVRFAQYFIDPLFQGIDKAALKGILRASFKKHESLMSTNKMRIDRLLKSLSEEGHPYRNLTFGTVEMLNKYAGLGNEPLDDILTNFYSERYSANLMTLVVWGLESLDALEQMVVASFGGIRNNKVEKLVFSNEQHPWKSNQLGHKIYIVPVEDKIRTMELTFRAPDVRHQYKISPEKYAIRLFDHKGPGTLGFILQKKGLCKRHSLEALYRLYAGIGFFTIQMDLTEEGSKKVDYILALTFQYIYLLKKKGAEEWFYDESKRLDELTLEKRSRDIDLSMIQSLASAMHDYPIEDILTYKFTRNPFDRTSIDEFLSYLRPNNVNISVSHKFSEDEADNIEPWYGTKYKIEKLSPELLQEWDSPSDLDPELKIPTPNEFIPDDLNVNSIPGPDADESQYPSIIYASSISRIWYKNEYNTSALTIVIEITCSLVYRSPMNRVLTNIFIRMLNSSIEDYEHFAREVSITYNIFPTESGIQVTVTGTNKVSIFLERVLSRMLNFEEELNEEDFEKAKEWELTYTQYFLKNKDSYATALFYAFYVRNQLCWGIREAFLMRKNGDLKYQRMKQFPTKLLSRIHIQGLIQGHCDEEKAAQIANTIDGLFTSTSRGVLSQEVLNPRIVHMDFGKEFVIHTYGNSSKNYYYAYFPFSSAYTTRDHTIGHLIFDMNLDACLKILPPQEVGTSECEIERVDNFFGLTIRISSSQTHPYHVDMRVERFLEIVHTKLQNTPVKEFDSGKFRTRMRLINYLNKDFPNHDFYWKEIKFHNYDFEKLARQKDILDQLSKEEVLDFFQANFVKGAPKRRKLVVYIFSKKLIGSTSESINTESLSRKEGILDPLPKEEVQDFFQETFVKGVLKRHELAEYVFSRSLIRSTPEDIAIKEINRDGIQSTKIENILLYKNSSSLSPTAVPDLVFTR